MNNPIELSEIQQWIQNYIADVLDIDSKDIDLEKDLADYGMPSIKTVRMAGDLEELLSGVEIDSSLMFEYDSLNALSKQLQTMAMAHQSRKRQEGQTLSVTLASSFTVEPIEESLNYWLKKLNYAPDISFSPYNQVFQELLNPASTLTQNDNGIRILLLRIEDWFRFDHKSEDLPCRAAAAVQEFIRHLTHFTSTHQGKLIVALCPHSQASVRALGLGAKLDEWDQQIIDAATKLEGTYVEDFRHLEERYSIRKIVDEARDKIGHIPFAPEFFAAMGMALSRRIHSILDAVKKVIVLDCDNTLWQGICGEEGAYGVSPDTGFQNFLIEQQKGGKLLCLCSKNNEDDAWEVFDKNPGMLLGREHIVAAKINWQRKSQNIAELAEELSLGLDSFIFIDDNPAECAEVSASLPQVAIVKVDPQAKDKGDFFRHHWLFDQEGATEEDSKRTQMYQQNLEREQHRVEFSSYSDFIADLNVEVQIEKLEGHDVVRAAQLSHRTNQFNATTVRRSESETRSLMERDDYDIFSVKVSDRFGDYGLVGLMGAYPEGSFAEGAGYYCDTFLMSCRVLAKQVEQAMVSKLAETALSRGCEELILQLKYSAKNKPVNAFYASLGAVESNSNFRGDCEGFEYSMQCAEVPELVAASKIEHGIAKKSAASLTTVAATATDRVSDEVFTAIANLAGDSGKVMDEIRSGATLKRGNLSTEYIAPRTAWQRKVAAIWCEVLGIDRVGIYDSFFDLGGDSLRAAEAFARMWDLGVPDSISLINIPEPTVAMLCQAIQDVKEGRKPTLITDQFSLADEGCVAEDIRNEGYDIQSYNTPMQNVFMTGATGYLGAFLLSELFLQSDVRVNCLVRAATIDEGRRRILKNMERYGLWSEGYQARLDITLGELSEPNLGLSGAQFKALARSIDTIFHSGAWVNFVYPYQTLKPSHVDATETIMRLAVADKPRAIALHFISTLGVIMSTGYGEDDIVLEDAPLEHVEGLLNGYEQAKHVADKMTWTGMQERGIPTAIYRPGMVGGLGTNGHYHKLDEFLSSFYKGCIQLGSWPLLNSSWEVIPVDYLCKAIVHGAKDPSNLNQAYFTLHPEETPVADYIGWFQDFGYNMRALPWDVWKRELIGQGASKLKDNALFPFVDFLRALYEEQVRFPTTDRSNFNRLVRDAGLEVEGQLDILEKYIRYFISVGYVQPPAKITPMKINPQLKKAG